MIRSLLLIVAVWAAIAIVRRVMASAGTRRLSTKNRGRMVTCEVCGVYLPSEEALQLDGERYRCDQHRRSSGASGNGD